MQIFLFFALFIAILAIIFAIQNNAATTVSFFIWQTDGSLALVLLIAIAVGALISFLAAMPGGIKNRLAIRNLNKKLIELEQRLDQQRIELETYQKSETEETQAKELPAVLPDEDI